MDYILLFKTGYQQWGVAGKPNLFKTYLEANAAAQSRLEAQAKSNSATDQYCVARIICDAVWVPAPPAPPGSVCFTPRGDGREE